VIRALGALARGGLTVEEAILQEERQGPLDPAARAWARDVTSGVLRHQALCEAWMRSLVNDKAPTGWLKRTMLVALYQLLKHDTPAGKIVDETVNLVKRQEGESRGRFVNALLRKAALETEVWRSIVVPDLTGFKKFNSLQWQTLAMSTGLPDWWLKEWLKDYSTTEIELRGLHSFFVRTLERPEFYARIEGKLEGERLKDSENAKEYLARLESEGRNAIIQDRASDFAIQSVHKHLTNWSTSQSLSQTPILDLCAAPGGKSIALSWLGWPVIATDYQAERLELLRSSCERVKNKSIECISWLEVENRAGPLDKLNLWVDAPCSSSGLIGKHPELKTQLKETELNELIEIQAKLLTKAYALSKPGCLLIYSVCSLFKKEGQLQVQQFLSRHSTARLLEEKTLGLDESDSSDGFYFAVLKV